MRSAPHELAHSQRTIHYAHVSDPSVATSAGTSANSSSLDLAQAIVSGGGALVAQWGEGLDRHIIFQARS